MLLFHGTAKSHMALFHYSPPTPNVCGHDEIYSLFVISAGVKAVWFGFYVALRFKGTSLDTGFKYDWFYYYNYSDPCFSCFNFLGNQLT